MLLRSGDTRLDGANHHLGHQLGAHVTTSLLVVQLLVVRVCHRPRAYLVVFGTGDSNAKLFSSWRLRCEPVAVGGLCGAFYKNANRYIALATERVRKRHSTQRATRHKTSRAFAVSRNLAARFRQIGRPNIGRMEWAPHRVSFSIHGGEFTLSRSETADEEMTCLCFVLRVVAENESLERGGGKQSPAFETFPFIVILHTSVLRKPFGQLTPCVAAGNIAMHHACIAILRIISLVQRGGRSHRS